MLKLKDIEVWSDRPLTLSNEILGLSSHLNADNCSISANKSLYILTKVNLLKIALNNGNISRSIEENRVSLF